MIQKGLLWKLIWFSLKVSITVFLHKSQTRTQGKRNQATTDPWVRLESRLTELWNIFSKTPTAKNTVISPNFLVWKFCGKTQFLQSFGRIARNYAETVPVQKIFTPRNLVKLRYFPQCNLYTPIHSFEITLSIIYYFWQYNHPWSSDVVFLQCRQANIIFNILPCGNKKICHFAFRVFW